jgi:hypothetical protein
MIIERRGFLGATAAFAVAPLDWLIKAGADTPGLRPGGALTDDRDSHLASLIQGFQQIVDGPGLLVVPPEAEQWARIATLTEPDIQVVCDPYCPPDKLYLWPQWSWEHRERWDAEGVLI